MTGLRVISVVTPVHLAGSQFLLSAYESLCHQALPDGWAWQWVVQEDGTSEVIRTLPSDSRISAGSGRKAGPATARMLGLSRAEGELIKTFDADDELTPGALARDISALERPDVWWSVSGVLDLLPNGSTASFDDDPPGGVIPPGRIYTHWLANSHRAQVHPATLCVKRDALLAVGGWLALPASEDTGLLLALSVLYKGYFTPEVGLYYRKWSGQMTASSEHTNEVERSVRIRVIEERVRALGHMFGGRTEV